MGESLPSARTYAIDIREVYGLKAEFVYNFFERDERINDSGTRNKKYHSDSRYYSKRPEYFTARIIKSAEFNKQTSRYIKLQWNRLTNNTGAYNYRDQQIYKDIILKNTHKIIEEKDFASRNFAVVNFSDTEREKFVNTLLAHQMMAQGIDASKQSQLDAAKTLINRSNRAISDAIITAGLVRQEEKGLFYSRNNQEIRKENLLKKIKNANTKVLINKKYLGDALTSVANKGHNLFLDEVNPLLKEAKEQQENQRRKYPSSVLNSEDYDFEINDYVGIRPAGRNILPRVFYAGYMIEKKEVLRNGDVVPRESIYISDPETYTTVDLKVKYGAKYIYSIKAIAVFESQVEDTTLRNSPPWLVMFLVASKRSAELNVHCVENVAPPWPKDLNIYWQPSEPDLKEKKLQLFWTFPHDIQQDIKKFQIFRRRHIREPFELQAVYDFDDTINQATDVYKEYPAQNLIHKMRNPKMIFIDQDFAKGKGNNRFIYAVCSVDAHGLTSNYSTQFMVEYDHQKDIIKKTLVGDAGAPKPYPNMTIKTKLFENSMKVSNAKKMHVIWTPEYEFVEDTNGRDMNLWKYNSGFEPRTKSQQRSNPNNVYKISLINLDRQQQKNVEIKLHYRARIIRPIRRVLNVYRPNVVKYGIRRRS